MLLQIVQHPLCRSSTQRLTGLRWGFDCEGLVMALPVDRPGRFHEPRHWGLQRAPSSRPRECPRVWLHLGPSQLSRVSRVVSNATAVVHACACQRERCKNVSSSKLYSLLSRHVPVRVTMRRRPSRQRFADLTPQNQKPTFDLLTCNPDREGLPHGPVQ